ncbi:hypothetical protein DACRYDRAFT_18693 [Dacryopinax primogenitus]|uniref:Uncharacterized protein n=1 Tax=Dacryopinax primogenitus (strain DJM 731) TaxID=1858805 RepID=M5FR13_DACPD|nr:uncharacterized protein DACRYDRAFT_18693 [Dacryopinax primogenitus]EJT97274.1 hypothetical protein DACRYDRAFT_18693 [Dacryopinax primogenitus]
MPTPTHPLERTRVRAEEKLARRSSPASSSATPSKTPRSLNKGFSSQKSKLLLPTPTVSPTTTSPTSPRKPSETQLMAPRPPPVRGPRPAASTNSSPNTNRLSSSSTASESSTGSGGTVMYGPRPRRQLVTPRKPTLPTSPAPHVLVYTSLVQSHHPQLHPPSITPSPSSAAPSTTFLPSVNTPQRPSAPRRPSLHPVQTPRATRLQHQSPTTSPIFRRPSLKLSTHGLPPTTTSSPLRPRKRGSQKIFSPAAKREKRDNGQGVPLYGSSLQSLRRRQALQSQPPVLGHPEFEPMEKQKRERDTMFLFPQAPLTPPKTPPLNPVSMQDAQQYIPSLGRPQPQARNDTLPPTSSTPPERPLITERISVINRPAPLALPPVHPSSPISEPEPEPEEEGNTFLVEPGKLRHQLAEELPIRVPPSRASVHRRPALRHVSTSSAVTAYSASSYGDTPSLEAEQDMVFAGEYTSSIVTPCSLRPAESVTALWQEVEVMLHGPSPLSELAEPGKHGEYQPHTASSTTRSNSATSAISLASVSVPAGVHDGAIAYIPVFGPALAAALARPVQGMPKTPSTASTLHEDVRDVVFGLKWAEEETWEDDEIPDEDADWEEEEELTLEGPTPWQERVSRRVFNRPSLRRSVRSMKRQITGSSR